jgi:hypothetical protein
MILKQISMPSDRAHSWMDINQEIVSEIIKRAEKENCFFDDTMLVPSGAIVLGIVNAERREEDYLGLILVNSESNLILTSAIIAFGQPWHEKFLINQQIWGDER